MSVISSMATAISGLEANGTELAIVSDNITNANTTAYKSSRGEFQNILASDLGSSAGSGQIGRGTMVAGVTTLFTQGPITKTDRPTDLALQGNGFFVLRSDQRGVLYTRDGSFRFDKDGWLTTLTGDRVQAYAADDGGRISGKFTDIRIPYKTIPARATNEMEIHLNLDARARITGPIDLERPDETSGYSTATQVFDSVGNSHPVSFHANRISENQWEWYAMTEGSHISGGKPGKQIALAKGVLTFEQDGKLKASEQSVLNTNFSNGAIPDQKLFFNFGDPVDQGGTGVLGSTMYGSKNATFRNVQDGYGAGVLTDTAVDDNGIITGLYTNGKSKTIGQVALARFESTERMTKSGYNQYMESVGSGQPIFGRANTNGFGGMMTKSLEQSNVDLAKEFVDMIKAQRGFQASAKTISSANEMLDEVIKLART